MGGWDADSGDAEWLDVGPGVGSAGPAGRPPSRRRWWYALTALAVLALVVVAVHRHDSGPEAGPSTAQPSGSSPVSTVQSDESSAPTSGSGTALPNQSVRITTYGRTLVPGVTDGDLFAYGPGLMLRIELASGRVTRTVVPQLASNGPLSFLTGSDRAIIRPLDSVPGYLVRDSRPAQALPTSLGTGGVDLPGPDTDHVWVQGGTDAHPRMVLVGFDGSRTTTSIAIPSDAGPISPDGGGYLLFSATGGVYDARPNGIHRITTGIVLAAGRTGWLSEDCDAQHHCSINLVEDAGATRHRAPLPVDTYQPGGLISPDGATAALLKGGGSSGAATLHVVDLTTGRDTATGVLIDPNQVFDGGTAFVWTSDSTTLFVADQQGRLVIVNRHSGGVTGLSLDLPELNQLAFRAPTS